jgi:sugar lactone lactonase YvrE
LLYATVPGDARKYANRLAVIDPQTGKVVTSTPVGLEPSKLALSDDSRYLYVVYDRTSITRFDLLTLRPDRSFQVTVGSPVDIPDIKVMPGHPDTVAVFLSGIQAIAIIDNGIVRPGISRDTFGNTLAFSSDTTLWASTTLITPNQVHKYNIDAGGVSAIGNSPVFYLSPFDRAIQFSNGAIYSSTGSVFDVGEGGYNGLFNTDNRQTSALAIDEIGNRIYFVIPEQYEASVLSFELTTFRQIGRLEASYSDDIGLRFSTNVMVLCGNAGLAFASRETDTVTILPFSAITPLGPYEKPDPVALNNSPRVIPLATTHIIYDAGRRLIYAGVPGTAGNIGNSITILDPFQGSVSDSIWVGSEPGAMALSTDGTWLYTGIDAASSIRRVHLPSKRPEGSFRLRAVDMSLNPTGFTRAEEIAALPDSPGSVLVGLAAIPNELDVGSDGVRVYDYGIQRPLSVPGEFVGGARFSQLSEDGGTAYAIEPSSNSQGFVTMRINQSGVQTVSEVFGIAGGRHLKCQSGLCFTEGGLIVDAKTSSLLGHFAFDFSNINFVAPNQVAPDVANGVVYFVCTSYSNNQVSVSAYSLKTHAVIKTFVVPGAMGVAKDLIIWGGNQLAFNTPTQIVLLPTALLTARAVD